MGTVVIAVMIVSLLIGAIGVGVWTLAHARLQLAERRVARAQASRLAAAALGSAAQWFEATERGSVVAPPAASDATFDRRVIDLDGDGVGPAWYDATAPWNVQYKNGGGDLMRPPDGPEAIHRFVGSASGPDLLLSSRSEDAALGAPILDSMTSAIAAGASLNVVRVAIFRPPDRAGEQALATIDVVATRAIPGARDVATRLRAEVIRVPWGRADRALIVEGNATFVEGAAWGRGEAIIGGDLTAPFSTYDAWPGGIPWLAPDRPLRDDNDGDGTPDDADGDGTADLPAWHALPGDVPDPWWRARIGGTWATVSTSGASCTQPFPFGPRASPPQAALKGSDRSGVFLRCAPAVTPSTKLASWRDLARLGVRGAWYAEEEEGVTGAFRLDGVGTAEPLADLLPQTGGLAFLSAAAARVTALTFQIDGTRGAVILEGAGAAISGASPSPFSAQAPGDPTDTAGTDRRAGPSDDFSRLVEAGTGCGPWRIGAWVSSSTPPSRSAAHACTEADPDFVGLIAISGALRIDGPWRSVGQVRAEELTADGTTGPLSLSARASSLRDAARRPGPPGAPRIVLDSVRSVP